MAKSKAPVTQTVSLEGDAVYKAALAALAREKGVFAGSLVRAALDAHYGDELKPLVRFFASRVPQVEHDVQHE